MDLYYNDSKVEYTDKILKCLDKIELYITRMIINNKLPSNILEQFKTKINELEKYINSGSFYDLLNQGYDMTLKFVHANISNMRQEFVESVRKGLVGYTLFYGSDVLEPTTINEFLHYIHNYITNNENFYFSIPTIKTITNRDQRKISLRGLPNELGNELYEGILTKGSSASNLDIINLEKRILIMARGLGRATVIEVEIENEDIFVNYYIPKNTNMEMVSTLKGIKVNQEEFAIGKFQTSKENFVEDICVLMKKIPTDLDLISQIRK